MACLASSPLVENRAGKRATTYHAGAPGDNSRADQMKRPPFITLRRERSCSTAMPRSGSPSTITEPAERAAVYPHRSASSAFFADTSVEYSGGQLRSRAATAFTLLYER